MVMAAVSSIAQRLEVLGNCLITDASKCMHFAQGGAAAKHEPPQESHSPQTVVTSRGFTTPSPPDRTAYRSVERTNGEGRSSGGPLGFLLCGLCVSDRRTRKNPPRRLLPGLVRLLTSGARCLRIHSAPRSPSNAWMETKIVGKLECESEAAPSAAVITLGQRSNFASYQCPRMRCGQQGRGLHAVPQFSGMAALSPEAASGCG